MNKRFNIQGRLSEAILAGLCVLTFVIYYQGVDGPYVRDDYSNLIGNNTLLITDFSWDSITAAALSSPSSKYYRPVSMLSFAANYTVAGNMQPYSTKITNIVLHIIIGIGIYFLTYSLLSLIPNFNLEDKKYRKIIALLTTSVWLLHPLNVSTVLYAVQRMAMLSTLFIVYACLAYVLLRQKLIADNRFQVLIPVVIILFTTLAFFSKENGALLPGFILLIEIFGFRFKYHQQTTTTFKYCLPIILVAPTVYIFIYLGNTFVTTIDKDIPNYFFTAYERVITQPRILWQYLGWSLLLNPEPMSIIQDGVQVSRNLFQPITTIISIVAWIVVISSAAMQLKTRNILIFALIWFLWGHAIESTVIPLAMIYEHRNYLPSIGILLALSMIATKFYESSTFSNTIKVVFLLIIFFITPATLLQKRVTNWQDTKSLMQSLVKKQAGSAYVFAEVTHYLDNTGDGNGAILAIQRAQSLESREPGFIIAEAALNCTYYPDRIFSLTLKDKLMSLRDHEKFTAYFLYHFRLLIKSCAGSNTNDTFMLGFYKKMTPIASYKLASEIKYAMKVIERRKNE